MKKANFIKLIGLLLVALMPHSKAESPEIMVETMIAGGKVVEFYLTNLENKDFECDYIYVKATVKDRSGNLVGLRHIIVRNVTLSAGSMQKKMEAGRDIIRDLEIAYDQPRIVKISEEKKSCKPKKQPEKLEKVKKTAISSSKNFRILTGASVYLRKQARRNAHRTGKLSIGTIVSELDSVTNHRGKIWHKVNSKLDGTGWISSKYTIPFNPAERAQAYIEVANRKLNNSKASFGDLVELCNFLNRVSKEISGKNGIKLKQLYSTALQRSFDAIPSGKKYESPYIEWLEENHDYAETTPYQIYIKKGNHLNDMGKIEQAYLAYSQAYKKATTKYEKKIALGSLAVTSFNLDQREECEKYLKKILEIDPENKWVVEFAMEHEFSFIEFSFIE
jgi:tetratricopeptide (TPR) repeat protein